jgi:glycosyltransferase involved in cell wall biosynthesis
MAHGGPRFVVRHGVSGWLAHNDDELLEAGLMLARDRALRCRLGTAARACAVMRSWETVCDRLYEVYGETM